MDRRDNPYTPGAGRKPEKIAGRQEYGRVLWNEIDESPITKRAVDALDDVVQDNLDGKFFVPQFDLASEAEPRYLLATAVLGAGPYRSNDAARAAGYHDTPAAAHLRDSLMRKELIWSPRRGYVDFTVPFFADYLRGAANAPP